MGRPKFVVFRKRTQLFLRVPTFKTEYRFRLVGLNGEIIAQSEGYTQKHSVKEVHVAYFQDFDYVDETGES